jgi:hypothetical protein
MVAPAEIWDAIRWGVMAAGAVTIIRWKLLRRRQVARPADEESSAR